MERAYSPGALSIFALSRNSKGRISGLCCLCAPLPLQQQAAPAAAAATAAVS